ncbi:hypothetical protein M501DRAFT_979578 [Patellaria atrata CBS 101060]|uniref:RBR-type E3 ubiquitin transferase n=1 Tax=Patellaria atrata CBS 101060 TaxID=1346257 RepID=A0A9P4VP67_9PEZI|nr:hypothetical protein M501DRAFT_979578 [Patellaria atrata CBS 101060]
MATTSRCVVCLDTEEETSTVIHRLGCPGHHMCTDCLKESFERAMRFEGDYPPTCCGREELSFVQYYPLMDPDFVRRYEAKEEEYSVPQGERRYCSNSECTTFLSPEIHKKDTSRAKCPNCNTITCTECKSEVAVSPNGETNSHHCEYTQEEVGFERAVREHRYQRCPNCDRVVELMEACNHITCVCDQEFCYICGEEWAGLHACPQYGHPEYDAEGYNQDGFHRDTGFDRDGHPAFDARGGGRGEGEEEEEEEIGERENQRFTNAYLEFARLLAQDRFRGGFGFGQDFD